MATSQEKKDAYSAAIGELYEAAIANSVFLALDNMMGSNANYKRYKQGDGVSSINAEVLAGGASTSNAAVNTRFNTALSNFKAMIAKREATLADETVVLDAAASGASQILKHLIKQMPASPDDLNVNIILGEVGGSSPFGDLFTAIYPNGQQSDPITQILELKMYQSTNSSVKYWNTTDAKIIGADNTFWRYLGHVAGTNRSVPWWDNLTEEEDGSDWREAIGAAGIFPNYLQAKLYGKNLPTAVNLLKTKFGASVGPKAIIRGYQKNGKGATVTISMDAIMANISFKTLRVEESAWTSTIRGTPEGYKEIGIFSISGSTKYLATASKNKLRRNSPQETDIEVSIPQSYFTYAMQKGGLY